MSELALWILISFGLWNKHRHLMSAGEACRYHHWNNDKIVCHAFLPNWLFWFRPNWVHKLNGHSAAPSKSLLQGLWWKKQRLFGLRSHNGCHYRSPLPKSRCGIWKDFEISIPNRSWGGGILNISGVQCLGCFLWDGNEGWRDLAGTC